MIKKYFNTPKMPLSFYISDLTIFHLLILLFVYFSTSVASDEKGLPIHVVIIWLFFIGLQSYTWSWFCSYILYKSGDSPFVQFMFRPFAITKQGAVTAALVSLATDVEHEVTYDKWGNGKIIRNYGSNMKALGCMAIVLLLPRLMLAYAIAPWTILFHVWIIKQLKKDIQTQLDHT